MIVLPDRTVILLSGGEVTHFLHNLITTNVETLADDEARPGALLTPQGKVLFDFLVSRKGDGYRLDVRADAADDFIKRLTLYKLRADVTIMKENQTFVCASWDADSATSDSESTSALKDRRFADGSMLRHYRDEDATDATAGTAAYDAQRVAHGVMECGVDYGSAEAFAHDVSLDQNGGIDFRKGCYVGQEVVSRMHHRKTARRRIVIVSGAVLNSGSTLEAGGKPEHSARWPDRRRLPLRVWTGYRLRVQKQRR
jgi:folate-binding protein YgfZ